MTLAIKDEQVLSHLGQRTGWTACRDRTVAMTLASSPSNSPSITLLVIDVESIELAIYN